MSNVYAAVGNQPMAYDLFAGAFDIGADFFSTFGAAFQQQGPAAEFAAPAAEASTNDHVPTPKFGF